MTFYELTFYDADGKPHVIDAKVSLRVAIHLIEEHGADYSAMSLKKLPEEDALEG
jgi:hypothetical protein